MKLFPALFCTLLVIPSTWCVAQDGGAVEHQLRTCNSCRHARAGWPRCIAPWARTTYGPEYCGYYVGGGVKPHKILEKGDRRFLSEGTWGVDYAPWYTKVALLWSHGRLYQGGTGQYEPEHRNWPFGLQRGPRLERFHPSSHHHHRH